MSLFAQDCGDQCASASDNGWYYACASSGGCTGVEVPLSAQVPNPVVFLPQDNNGVIVELPAVPLTGTLSATGALVLGIGTQANNQLAGVAAYPVDQYGDFSTQLAGQSPVWAFLDTGSNGLFFSSPSSTLLPDCTNDTGWFCPSATVTLAATNTGSTGSPSRAVAFQIANFETLAGGSNNVFGNVGGSSPQGFDWGLPFHLGRHVYLGFEGKSSSLGSGPMSGF